MRRWRGGTRLPALLLTAALGICGTGTVAAVVRRRPASLAVVAPAGVAPQPPTTAAAAVGVTAERESGQAPVLAAPAPTVTFTAPAPTAGSAVYGDGVVWAVVIGINDYPGTERDLNQAVADADAMLAALAGFGVDPARVVALRDTEASSPAITGALDWLRANAGPSDTAVVFYAGHVRKLGMGAEAVLAADELLVTDATMAEHLAGMAARDAWIVMAACYGGGFTELLAPGRVLTAAADADNLSYESVEYPYSYLVQYAVQQPLGERLTAPIVQDAVAYGWAELGRIHPDRQLTSFDHAGHPIVLDRSWAPTTTPPAPASSPPPAPPPAPPPTPSSAPPSSPPPSGEPPGCQGLLAILCG